MVTFGGTRGISHPLTSGYFSSLSFHYHIGVAKVSETITLMFEDGYQLTLVKLVADSGTWQHVITHSNMLVTHGNKR